MRMHPWMKAENSQNSELKNFNAYNLQYILLKQYISRLNRQTDNTPEKQLSYIFKMYWVGRGGQFWLGNGFSTAFQFVLSKRGFKIFLPLLWSVY